MIRQKLLLKGQTIWSRLSRQILKPRRFAIFEACLIGLVSALAAILLEQGVGWLGGWRIRLSHQYPAYLVLPAIGLVGGLLSGWLVERFAPAASGSGMSEVKAVLARVPLPLNLKVALIKLVSATLILGTGLPLGREGPTVQIGAALASQLSQWFPTSPNQRRQLIAAGSGAGLAAAFNAPIAGVLFVVEELLQDVSGITLGTAILASFIAAAVTRAYGSQSLDLDLNLVSLPTSFSAEEIPFYLLLGGLAGLLGVLFNRGVVASLALNRRISIGLPWRIGLAGCLTGLVVAMLPFTFRDNAGLRQLLLSDGLDWRMTTIAFVAQFALILFTYGSGAPGGLLVPTLVLGAALGYLVGVGEHSLLGLGLATTYARVGMAAFFSAVARVPITAIVIVFEMTTDFNLVLPLMIGSVTAYVVGERISAGSLYDRLLEWKGIHLEKESSTDRIWAQLTAANVMQRRVETLSSGMTLDEALQAFSQSTHRSFPVVAAGKVVGIISQKDLAAQRQRPGETIETTVEQVMTPSPVTAHPDDTLAHVLGLLNHYELNCLPIVDGRRLVGIITRSDIIRVEAAYLHGSAHTIGPSPDPSRVVYQTRAPEIGQGRLLVPISNPKTAPILLKLAIAIAHEHNYEIECLQVIVLPQHQVLAEAAISTASSQRLLRQAIRLGQAWKVPVHTQIRLAHDLAEAILETIKAQHIDRVLMGWKGSTTTPGRVFSRVTDAVIRQAACEVVLVKLLNDHPSFDRWLVPMAGGPNAQSAIKLLPALTTLSSNPEVRLFQVFHPADPKHDTALLKEDVEFLHRRLQVPVIATTRCAESVAHTVIEIAQHDHCDVIVLGASREGMLQQVFKGNIPEAIARESRCTVILVRGALSTQV